LKVFSADPGIVMVQFPLARVLAAIISAIALEDNL